MERDEFYIIRLHDCFTAGYTLPQYCIDNGIKKPLFFASQKNWQLLWEIYVQFAYDKRIVPTFSFYDLTQNVGLNYSVECILGSLQIKGLSESVVRDCDTIICLTTTKIFSSNAVIYLDALTTYFIRKAYCEIPLLHFLQRNPKVHLIVTNYPRIDRPVTKREKKLCSTSIHQINDKISSSNKMVATPYDFLGYTNQEVHQLLEMVGTKVNLDGSTSLEDSSGSLVGVRGGKRITTNQPKDFRNTVYFMGTCTFLGIGAPFDKTIESYLQQPYRVENESQFFADRYQDVFYNLNNLPTHAGDIIFICLQNLVPFTIPFIDISKFFNGFADREKIFVDKDHVNELGYKILAEKYFSFLTENNFFRDVEFNYHIPPPSYHRYGIPPQFEAGGVKIFVNEELEAYKKTLRKHKTQIGALVMNCNPFTLGHQYLVEYASSKVAKLYLFVVEEDKSEFPFADRIELVRQGVKDFSNVEVLPSGKFIISQQTFSGYFNKASLQDVAVDSSEDVEIFAKEIAPTLGITVRFAGEEPTDNVTRQYNETMKEILPKYGMEFCEIPRKNFGDEPISASKVREALKVGDFDKIKNLVPPSTLLYIRERYSATK